MKMRVRVDGTNYVVDLGENTSSNITLHDAKEAIRRVVHLDTQDFQLSLNGTDSLSDENSVMSDHGIVSGDLLHVTGTNGRVLNHQRNAIQQQSRISASSSSYTSSSDVQRTVSEGKSEATTSPSSSIESISFQTASSTAANSLAQHPIRTDTDEDIIGTKYARSEAEGPIQINTGRAFVNRYMQEPLVLRESTTAKVPALLTQLYLTSGSSCQNDALWVALHTLMLETGFVPVDSEDPSVMPMSWKHSGFYSCTYNYTINTEVTTQCSLVGITIGSSIVVHGLSDRLKSFKTDHLQLKSENFVGVLSTSVPTIYKALDRLSRQFKDVICLPLVNEMATAAGFTEVQGLLSMPCEVRIRIMTFLNAKSVCQLSETCQEWNSFYKERTVWRLLYFRDFGAPLNVKLARNWFELYKAKYEEWKEEQIKRRQTLFFDESLMPPWPFPRINPFQPAMPPPPHFLGPDRGLDPDFEGGFEVPIGRRRPEVRPVLMRPLHDSLNHLRGMRGLPLHGRHFF